MTKVYISPGLENAPYGIKRLVEALVRYLPQYGVTPVKTAEEADVVHVHATAFVKTDKPVLYTSHGLYWEEDNWPIQWKQANQAMIDYMVQADGITAVSQWVAHALSRGILRRPEVITHGIDTAEWQPGSTHGGYVLWNKARVDPVSDPAPLNRLAEMMPDVPFVTTFGDRRPNVQITGAVTHGTMRDMAQQAAVYLSTTRETFGIGTLEALACGVPVVGWAIGGNLEIVEQGVNGILVPHGDYDALSEAIRIALGSEEMRQAARETAVTSWGWEPRIKQYANALTRLVDKREAFVPKVSIVVTAHNMEPYLEACLDSVRLQPFADWECLVVDDVSTDSTPRIAQEFAEADGRFRYIRTPANLLTAGARNYGIAQADGKYILPLDGDDMLAEDALTPLVGALDTFPRLHIAYGKLDLLNEDATARRPGDWPNGQFNWFDQMAHLNQLPYCAMMRRDVWAESGGYRTRDRWTEDANFWTHVTSFGFRAARVTDQPVLLYRVRSSSKSHGAEAQNVGWTSWYPWRLAVGPEDGYKLRKSNLLPPAYIVPFGAQGNAPDGVSWPVWRHDEPLVSVVIPCGPGHGKYLQDAVDSVQAQTFPWWECIVVDNTLSDELTAVTLPPWARVVRNDTAGIAASRNMGWQAARAPLVLFLDADDFLTPNCLADLLGGHVESEGRYTYGDWVAIGEKIQPESSRPYSQAEWGKHGLHSITCLLPREWIAAVGGFDPAVPGWEDWDFFIRLAIGGYCGHYVKSTTMGYRLHGGQRREQSLRDATGTLELFRGKYSDWFDGRKQMSGCCGGNGSTIIEAKRRLGMMSRPSERSVTVSDGKVRIEAVGENKGSRTYTRVSGSELSAPVKLGNNSIHRYADVIPADAKLLVDAGYARYVDRPGINMAQVAGPKPDIFVPTKTAVTPSAPPEQAPTEDLADIAAASVTDLKVKAAGLSVNELRELLDLEQAGANRKTAVSFLETLIADAERVG